jgi:hypothetical protein
VKFLHFFNFLVIFILLDPDPRSPVRIQIQPTTISADPDLCNTDKSAYPNFFADQNLVDVSVKDLEVVNTVVANNDEILDVVHLGVNASHLAVACNSSALRLYEVG